MEIPSKRVLVKQTRGSPSIYTTRQDFPRVDLGTRKMSTVIAHAKKMRILPTLSRRSSVSVNLDSGLLGALGALDVSW